MANFYLAPVLAQLRKEVDAAHPKRDRRSDGWVGDTSHSARRSDHNPDYKRGGVVRALDIDKDGVNTDRLLEIAIKNPSTNYIIWNGHIYSRTYAFRKRVYTGPNKHTQHMHISIRVGKAYENRTTAWGYSAPSPVKKTVVQKPAEANLRSLQLAIRATADGKWGPTTDKHMDALRLSAGYHGGKHPFGVAFTQKVVGAKPDGSWGPASIKAHKATVTELQKVLVALGYKILVNGTWSPSMENAYRVVKDRFR